MQEQKKEKEVWTYSFWDDKMAASADAAHATLRVCVYSLWLNSDTQSHLIPVKARNSNSYHKNSFTFAVCKYL